MANTNEVTEGSLVCPLVTKKWRGFPGSNKACRSMRGLAMLGKRKIGRRITGKSTRLEAGPWRNAATEGKCKGQPPRAQPKVGKGREYIQRDKVFITM